MFIIVENEAILIEPFPLPKKNTGLFPHSLSKLRINLRLLFSVIQCRWPLSKEKPIALSLQNVPAGGGQSWQQYSYYTRSDDRWSGSLIHKFDDMTVRTVRPRETRRMFEWLRQLIKDNWWTWENPDNQFIPCTRELLLGQLFLFTSNGIVC